MKAINIKLQDNIEKVLSLLDTDEEVQLMQNGEIKAILKPVVRRKKKSVRDHPFFAMNRLETTTVEKVVNSLRNGRYDDI